MAKHGFGTYLYNLESTLMLNLFNLDLLSDVTSYVVQSTKYSQMHREGLFLKLAACLLPMQHCSSDCEMAQKCVKCFWCHYLGT